MGNACTTGGVRKRDIIIPSTIDPRPKNVQNSEPQIEIVSKDVIADKNDKVEEPFGGKEIANNSKGNKKLYLHHNLNIKELGIGQHYMENEIQNDIDSLPKTKRNNMKKNNQKLSKILNELKEKMPYQSNEGSLYNETDILLQKLAQLKPKVYKKMLKRGVSSDYRWSVWKNHMQIHQFYEKNLYEKLSGLSSKWEDDIIKDVHRTFPKELYFSSEKYDKVGQKHLFNVLKALSLYFPNIGYAQSMNYIVAFLLLVNGAKEEEAFWMFVTLARDHKFLAMGLFEQQFPVLQFYTFVFYEQLHAQLPSLYNHIKKQQFPDLLWLFKWFLTIFLYSFPAKQVLRFWDYVMTRGLFSMIQVALGLVKVLEKDMLCLDILGIDGLFKQLKGDSPLVESQIKTNEEQNAMSKSKEIVKSLDIDQVLKYADRIPLKLEKIAHYSSIYTTKTGKPFPEFYEKFYKEWYKIRNQENKIIEFQKQIDIKITKSEIFKNQIIAIKAEINENPEQENKHKESKGI